MGLESAKLDPREPALSRTQEEIGASLIPSVSLHLEGEENRLRAPARSGLVPDPGLEGASEAVAAGIF